MRPTLLLLGLGLAALPGCSCYGISASDELQRMETQDKVLPYSANDLYADGRGMRAPPEGSVSREAVVGAPGISTGMVDGALVTRIPIPVTEELLARGRHRFEIVCSNCHGLVGNGDSMVADNMATRLPPSLVAIGPRPVGFFFKAITEGYGLMPSFAGEVPTDERWAVVAYIRALQLSQNAPVSTLPADVQRRLREGESWQR